MRVMAFCFTPEQVRILEHNDRFYGDLPDTWVLRLSYELTAQLDYLYHERCERNRVAAVTKDHYRREWEAEENRAYEHIRLMHEQVSDSHLHISMATYVRQHKEG